MAAPAWRQTKKMPGHFETPTQNMEWSKGLRAQLTKPGSHLRPGGIDLGDRTTQASGVRAFTPFKANRNLNHDEFGTVLFRRPERRTIAGGQFGHYSGPSASGD